MKTKKDPRHQARRVAILVLFEWTFHKDASLSDHLVELTDQSDGLLSNNSGRVMPHDEKLLSDIVNGLPKYVSEIDTIITKSAPEWPIDQISRVDLAILRLSIFELLHRQETPTKVAIDEAVELAKEFGGANSSKFVNGVLGTVVKKHVQPEEQTPSADAEHAHT